MALDAGVRYWEDAYLNGVEDIEGSIPFREGDRWKPVIELNTGRVSGWPEGLVADIHYKVCDDGEYFLRDAADSVLARWRGYYVPDDILCIADEGLGDYLIFTIEANGLIKGWAPPLIRPEQWEAV